jgi:PAS domain S-box-containing protein
MINTGTNTGKSAFAAALAAVVVGAGVLAGWFFGLEFLKRIAPGFVAMNPATAAAFILAGASLALFLWSPQGNDQKSRARILAARLYALLVALIGLAKLADILCDCDLNVDQWLFASKLSDDLRFPNRMAPNTAFSFLLLGSALLFVDVKNRSARFWSEFSVILVGLGSLLAVLAYAYDIQSFYGLSTFIPMALPTAITFSVLTVAFLLSHTDSGLLAILAGDSGAGGTMARLLLPAAIIVPAVFGWLALKGEQVGIYHGAFGDAVEAVGNILVYTLLVCWSAQRLFNADLGRKKAEEALRRSETKFRTLYDSTSDAVMLLDEKGFFDCNQATLAVFGCATREEFCSKHPADVSPPVQPDGTDSLTLAKQHMATAMEKGSHHFEWLHKRADTGETFSGEVLLNAMELDGKRVLQATVRDITARKQAEQALASSLSLLRATLESTADGLLVVDQTGQMVQFNQKFVEMWGIPADILASRDDSRTIAYVLEQLKDPGSFVAKVKELYAQPEAMSFDVLEFKDGRTFERYSQPQKVGGKGVGRVWSFRDITERKQAEVVLMETSALLEALLQNTTDKIYFKDLQSRFVRFSQQCLEIFHLTQPAELKGKTDFDFFSEEHARPAFEAEQEIIRTGKPIFNLEEKETHRDGRVSWALTSKMAWRDQAGNVIGTMGISRDITARKRMEEQLFQSQKMETVGKLAGGVAHEFNSILTAIICQSELLLEDLPAGSPLAENATEIRSAAERAAVLTRQLLAYGRKQFLQPEILDLNAVLAGLESALRHLLGPGADVRLAPAAGLKAVKADAGQLEQVIMNLAMNAADAMPNGGQLTLETANVTLDQEYVSRFPELKAGDYVMLAITDTGMGMSEEVKARVFEPFFTTKDVGQGTGLGLSTCYGILKQSGGHISVYSELARGATFKIYLPQVGPLAKNPLQRLASPDLPRGTETILLVEDDPALREMAATLLRRLGYTVLAAANGLEALRLKQQRGSGHMDLLFTDVVMPHMSGKELADRVRALSPHTRILFTSGYTENTIVQQGGLNPGVVFLQKPFTPSALARKVREVLDEPGVPQPATAQ